MSTRAADVEVFRAVRARPASASPVCRIGRVRPPAERTSADPADAAEARALDALVEQFGPLELTPAAVKRLVLERVAAAVERERSRFRLDVHDLLGARFGALAWMLNGARDLIVADPETAAAQLEIAERTARAGLAEARRTAMGYAFEHDDRSDLAARIERWIVDTRSSYGPMLALKVAGKPYPIAPVAADQLVAIVREAISNAARHGAARQVVVGLHYLAKSLSLHIADDGCGFDPEIATVGLGRSGMRGRARRIGARLTEVSAPGAGTRIEVRAGALRLRHGQAAPAAPATAMARCA